MPDKNNLDTLLDSFNVPSGTPTNNNTLTNTTNEYNPNTHLDQILQSFGTGGPHLSATPGDLPQGSYNQNYDVSRENVNVDDEVFNSLATDAWNSFKRGIDNIQIATDVGKINYSMFSENAPAAIVDEYPDDIKRLQDQLDRGIISQVEFDQKKMELDTDLANAQKYISEKESRIRSNEEEIRNEPVSKEYEWRNFVTQSQGDSASIIDKMLYSMPNVLGSSASLMIPQLMATFGNNITRALIRSSAAYILGPEAGLPANIIGTVGAIAGSVAEVLYGRSQESYGEVGSTIMENQERMYQEELPRMMQKWAQDTGVDLSDNSKAEEINAAQEEFKRQLRIQSRKGADTQFKQNMALAAVDVAQAILMPMSNFGSGVNLLSKTGSGLREGIESIRDYNKATRILSTLGRQGLNAYGEKFEEGFQLASQLRAESSILDEGLYKDDGIIKNIINDSYDTVSSLNYSLIPGIDMRGDGRYSKNSEFQFSENSGGLLGLVMGAIPTALSIGQDIRAYKQANQALANNGIVDIDGKFRRLSEQIYQKYYNRGDTHHIVQGVVSLLNKKDEQGNPVLTREQADQIITDLKTGQNMYESLTDKLEKIAPKDTWFGFRDSKEQAEAKRAYKADVIHTILGIQDSAKKRTSLNQDRVNQISQDKALFTDPATQEYSNLMSQVAANQALIKAHKEALNNPPEGSSRAIIESHLELLDIRNADLMKSFREESEKLEQLGIDPRSVSAPSIKLQEIDQKLQANELFEDDYRRNYSDLSKIDTREKLKAYREKIRDRFSPLREENVVDNVVQEPEQANTPATPTINVTPEQAPQSTPSHPQQIQEFANKIARGVMMSDPADVQFYKDNTAEIEDLLRNMGVPNMAPRPKEVASTTTTPEENIDPSTYGPTPVGDIVEQSVEEADNELRDQLFGILQSGDSLMNKANNLASVLTSMGIPVEDMTVPKIYEGMVRHLFDGDTIRAIFPELKRVLTTINPNQEDINLDDVTLDLIIKSPLPSTQEGNYATEHNKKLQLVLTEGDPMGTGLKITSGLSIATANIEGVKDNSDGQWYDYRGEDGRLVFSANHHQQLVNTNLVKKGDTLYFKVENMPSNFNPADLTDSNYDQVEVGVYREMDLGGGATQRVLIGYMHRVAKLAELLALENPNVDLETEQRLLRTNRFEVISKLGWHKASIVDKGFGYLSLNRDTEQLKTTVAALVGTDTRPRLSIVDKIGRPVPVGRMTLAMADSAQGMTPGMNILLLPNETGNGTVYFPAVLTKNKLGADIRILDKVHQSIVEYLSPNGSITALQRAERYVYITRIDEDRAKLGKTGVARFSTAAGEKVLQVNGQFFNETDFDQDKLRQALAEVYFNINQQAALEENGEYQREIMNSPVLTTNITANPILLERSRTNEGEYSNFLKDNDRYTYFHQHTIVHDTVVPEETQELTEMTIEESALPVTGEEATQDSTPTQSVLVNEELPEVDISDIDLDNIDLDSDLSDLGLDLPDFDDVTFSSNNRPNSLLISPDIPASLQAQMIDVVAFRLLTTERSDVSNIDRARATIKDKFNELNATVAKYNAILASPTHKAALLQKDPRAEDKIDKMNKMRNNYSLLNTHFDEVARRAQQVLSNLGFELTDEDDYYENVTEEESTSFRDDQNRLRDEKQFLPGDVKKLLYFIPELEQFVPTDTNPSEPKGYEGKGYQPTINAFGLPNFNDFNDTWEKTLSRLSNISYSSSIEGYNKMLTRMKSKESPFIVQEIANKLESAPEQVANAFFRKTNLQLVKNRSMNFIEEVYTDKTRKDSTGAPLVNRRTFGRVIFSDQRQSEKSVAEELENEFRVANTGMLIRQKEEGTGRDVLVINSELARKLAEQVELILANPNNFKVRAGKGNLKSSLSTEFEEVAREQLYDIVKNGIGLNISRSAFDDLLKYHRAGEAKVRAEVSAFKEIFLNRILATLSGEGTAGYSDYEKNNPFKADTRNINAIAKYEYKYRKQRQSGAYRYQGKSYYPYMRHNMLSEGFTQIEEFKETGVDTFIGPKLTNDVFARYSRYLNILSKGENTNFIRNFGLYYELGSKNQGTGNDPKMLVNMTPREHQITKLRWFQNQGHQNALFMYDTLSDKVTKPVVQAQKVKISYDPFTTSIQKGNIRLSDDNLEILYQYFLAEYHRIQEVTKQNKDFKENAPHRLIKGYHDTKSVGMGKYFNIYYFLNKEILDASERTRALSSKLFNEDGSLKVDILAIDPAVKAMVKSEINLHMNRIYAKTKKDFAELGLFEVTRDSMGNLITDIADLVDHNYLTNEMGTARNNNKALTTPGRTTKKLNNPGVAVQLGLDKIQGEYEADKFANYSQYGEENVNRIVDYAIIDYVYNYVIFSNEMLMFTGDPAQAGKPVKNGTLLENIESTYVNLGKRNAAFLGSGERGRFDSLHYTVAIANDMAIGSEETKAELEQYLSWFPQNKSGVEKAYSQGDLTDAQEFTTVKEHLHVMKAFGAINQSTYQKALFVYDPEAYFEEFSSEPELTQQERLTTIPKVIFQPQKPVQRTYTIEDDMRISKQYYIKTSSYPLIPSMVTGIMKDMLDDMKRSKVDRVAFVSGVKQGVAGSKDLFKTEKVQEGDSESKRLVYNKSFFKDNLNVLTRDGFRIQLEVPYKAYKHEIREGTQMSKLLFVDIPDKTSATFQGRETTVGELKQLYVDYHKSIIDLKTKELYRELGIPENGDFSRMSLKKLSQILIKEAEGRGYSMNSMLGLQLTPEGEFEVPLTFLPNAAQIEPVITALVSNRISRLKMPGKSYVQGSEFMLRTGQVSTLEDYKDSRGIVWTKPEYAGLEKLLYLRKEGDVVKPAQIIMPFYFIKDHKRVPVSDYTDKKTGLLDISKIDPELLEMNGFRIPFQGHNSGMWFEIVGFLPEEAGDLIIVPGQIAGQMGSDYDVDKLYSYMFNYSFGVGTTIEPTTVYQGRKGEKDNRRYNYYTTSKEEAASYGDVEESTLELSNILEAFGREGYTLEYSDFLDEFKKKTGKYFDIYDNSPEGLKTQEEFFKFLEGKGYAGLSMVHRGGIVNDQQVEDRYVITFDFTPAEKINKVKSTNPETIEALQNALIDIHKSIFTNSDQEIQRAILNPLSFQTIEDTIDEFGSQVGSEFLGAFDTIYQRDVYFSNVTGKSGTAISANANTGHALAQTANLYIKGQGIVFKDNNNVTYSDYSGSSTNSVNDTDESTYSYSNGEVMVNQNDITNESAWRLDKILTFPDPDTGIQYKISDLISQVLGVSVDNAKEQKLGAFGINNQNFNIALNIIRTGFNFRYVYAFINQPVLKEYYTALGETEDIFRVDYTPGKKDAAIEALYQRIAEIAGMSAEQLDEIRNKPEITGYSLNDMRESLNKSIDKANAIQQINILRAFLHYKTISDAVQLLTSTFNIDVKGNPKNMSETVQKIQDIHQARSNNDVLGNVDKYVSKTIPGLFLFVPDMTAQMFMNPNNPMFAYNSAAYKTMFDQIMNATGRTKLSQEQIDLIHAHVKQFVYSGFSFEVGDDITETRKRLLFDYDENESLQTRLIRLKMAFPKNDLLNAVQIETSIYPDNPKLVKIPMTGEDNYAQRVSEYWEYMMYEEPNEDLKRFAQDLYSYALYVNPQEYGLSNMIRYMPPRAMQEGFTSYLRSVNKMTNNVDNEGNDIDLLTGFTRQFVQHNVQFLVSVTAAYDKIIKETGVFEKRRVFDANQGREVEQRVVLNSFTLPPITDDITNNPAAGLIRVKQEGNDQVSYYPEYLAYYVDEKYKKQIFERRGNPDGSFTYYRIDKLGDTNMSEYVMGARYTRSMIGTNRANSSIPTGDTSAVNTNLSRTLEPLEVPVDKSYLSDTISLADDMLDGMISVANDITINPSATVLDVTYANYYIYLSKVIKAKGLPDTRIVIDNTFPAPGSTTGDGSTITLNPTKMNVGRTGLSTELERQRTILHEMVHALTFKELSEGRRNSKEFQDVIAVWEEFKSQVRSESSEKIRGISKSTFNAELFTVLKRGYDKARRSDNTDVSRVDLNTYITDILSDDRKLRDTLTVLGTHLNGLKDPTIKNTDLVSDQDRYLAIRAYIVEEFQPELRDKINTYYAYFHPYEFMTEVMTNNQLQKRLQKMPSIWNKLVSAIRDLIANILGIEQEERSLFDDSMDAIFKFLRLDDDSNTDSGSDSVPLDTNPTTDTFRYYGKMYEIVLDPTGKGISVVGYKGKYNDMKKILDYYNQDPNVDPQNGKNFREPEVEVPSQGYAATKEDMLNSGQRIAVQKAMNIIDAPTNADIYNDMFLLSGKGGTGKTFTTEVIYDRIRQIAPFSRIVHVAPTWNAVNEIVKASSKEDYAASTLASFVGTELSEPNEQGVQKFLLFSDNKIARMPVPPAIFTADYIIIDEASMIGGDGMQPKVIGTKTLPNGERENIIESSDAWQTILYRLKQREAMGAGRPKKIILVGDYAQIPPVGTTSDHDAFIIERMMQNESSHHVLIENMRTGNEDLNALHERYRANIDKAREAIKKGISSNDSIPRNIIPFNERKNTANISYVRSETVAIDTYVNYYLQDPENVSNVVFVNYNNINKPQTQRLVSAIRSKLFGQDINNPYNPGELLLLSGNMESEFMLDGRKTEITWHNETRFYVKNVLRNQSKTIVRTGNSKGGQFRLSKEFKGTTLTLVTDFGKKRVTFDQFIPNPGEIERVFGKYQPSIKGFMVDGRVVPYAMYLQFKDSLPTLNYGYVVNSHKVQGSTYNYTIVDEQNILSSPATNKEVNNMLYTAVSRPKYKLVVLNAMNPEQSGNQNENEMKLPWDDAAIDSMIVSLEENGIITRMCN